MIPLFQVALDDKNALANLERVFATKYIGEGQMCAALELELEKVLCFPVLLTNSGTSALHLALHLAGARAGTEVISTPQTCLATNAAIAMTGARIVWADIDPKTGNIDPESVFKLVGPKTRAVMAVDWGGRVCDFGKLRDMLPGISLIEDAAHAFAAAGPDRGDFVCLSFQAIKHFTTGDGGALAVPSAALRERGRLLRWFGLDRTRGDAMRCYQNVAEWGWKYQSNDIAAAIGLANISGARDRVAACRNNAAWYTQQLRDIPGVKLPPSDPGSAWWIYTIRVSSPPRFAHFMAARGIAVGQVHVRNDAYPCFSDARGGALPGVDEFNAHQTNIPCGWWLTEDARQQVASAVEAWSKTPEAAW